MVPNQLAGLGRGDEAKGMPVIRFWVRGPRLGAGPVKSQIEGDSTYRWMRDRTLAKVKKSLKYILYQVSISYKNFQKGRPWMKSLTKTRYFFATKD